MNFVDPSGYVGTTVSVTLPNGKKVNGTVTNGITWLSDGSRPPEGAVVHTSAGDYKMQNGSGVKVSSGGSNTAASKLTELTGKINLVNGYFEAQKKPSAAQQGARDAINQLSWAIGVENAPAKITVKGLAKKEILQYGKKVIKGTGMLKYFEYKLTTIPGVSTATAGKLIAGIGDIRRFSNTDKLARYAGIAPIKFSSAGKGKEQSSKQGNRELHGLFYFLAVSMVTVPRTGKPNQPVFYAYYQRKISEGRTKSQALVCIMRGW